MRSVDVRVRGLNSSAPRRDAPAISLDDLGAGRWHDATDAALATPGGAIVVARHGRHHGRAIDVVDSFLRVVPSSHWDIHLGRGRGGRDFSTRVPDDLVGLKWYYAFDTASW